MYTSKQAFTLGWLINPLVMGSEAVDGVELLRTAFTACVRALSVDLTLDELKALRKDSAEIRVKEVEKLRGRIALDLSLIFEEQVAAAFNLGYYLATLTYVRTAVRSDRAGTAADVEKVCNVVRGVANRAGARPNWMEPVLMGLTDEEIGDQEFSNLIVAAFEKLSQWFGEQMRQDSATRGVEAAANGQAPASKPASNLMFVVMPMDLEDDGLPDVLDALKTVAQEFKMEAKRVDDFKDGNEVTRTVLQKISEASVVIVDVTGNRPNVYFEAGYALGRGKKPIYIAREKSPLAFDIQNYQVIFFRSMIGLKDQLRDTLKIRTADVIIPTADVKLS